MKMAPRRPSPRPNCCARMDAGTIAHRLIHGIADAGILTEEELDELAHGFLYRKWFMYRYPVNWIGTDWIAVSTSDGDPEIEGSVERLPPETPVTATRYIVPPLRRWASERVLRGEPRNFDLLKVFAFSTDRMMAMPSCRG